MSTIRRIVESLSVVKMRLSELERTCVCLSLNEHVPLFHICVLFYSPRVARTRMLSSPDRVQRTSIKYILYGAVSATVDKGLLLCRCADLLTRRVLRPVCRHAPAAECTLLSGTIIRDTRITL
jgi:hypothetical protein